MLNDNQMAAFLTHKDFLNVTKSGLNQFVKDIVKSGNTDIKPNCGFLIRVSFLLIRARLVRKELLFTSVTLIERFINFELSWNRSPESIRDICESDEDFLWMRYDEKRVECLFNRTISIFQNYSFRNLIKSCSSIISNKNERLTVMLAELKNLKENTLFSIQMKGMFDHHIKITSSEYYKQNERRIVETFLNNSNFNILPHTSSQENG